MKKIMLIVFLTNFCIALAEPKLSVSAKQRYPWNGYVDIDCKVQGFGTTPLGFVAKDNATGRNLKIKTLTYNGIEYTNGVSMVSDGNHRILWNAQKDIGDEWLAADVLLTAYNGYPRYMVIDLSGGVNYNIELFDEIPGGTWSDEFKTTKLVMRRIPGDEKGLIKPFYIGIFEVTQKQYQLVVGKLPRQLKVVDDLCPVEYIRRGLSPTAPDDLVPFVVALRDRTRLPDITLPSVKEWEYACRAGTTTKFNNGTDKIVGLGRFNGNRTDGKGGGFNKYTRVGSYIPNAWGIYDLHGNVWEWTIDSGSSGTWQCCGGAYICNESECSSNSRNEFAPYYMQGSDVGFRVVCHPEYK